MRTRRTTALALLATLGFVFAACGDDDAGGADEAAEDTASADTAEEGTATGDSAASDVEIDPDADITFITSVAPRNFDPHTSSSIIADYPHISLVYDRLIEARKGPELVPMIAESWEFADDGTALNLNLDRDATFQDGSPIDAEAVKANLDRAMTLEESTVKSYLDMVDSVEVVDEGTVRLNTNRPAADLPATLSSLVGSIINPVGFEDPELATNPYGSGPFEITDLVIDDRVTVTRVEDYWNPDSDGRANSLTIIGIPDDMSKLNTFQTGQADVSWFKMAAWDDFSGYADSQDGVEIVTYPRTATYQIFLNTENEILANQTVRQALNHAIDRDLINETLMSGQCPPTTQMLQDVYPGHAPALDDLYPYDPDLARDLLAEAGYPDGFEFEIGVGAGLTPQSLFPPVLQQMFGEIGVDVTVVEQDYLEINPRWAAGELDAYSQTRLGAPDPGVVLRDNYLQGPRFPGPVPPQVEDAIIATLDPTSTEEERAALLEEANTLISEQALDIFICKTPSTFIYNDDIVGVDEMGQADFQGVFDARYLARTAG